MNDELFEKLAGLTTHDIDDWRKQRARDRAHKALSRRRRYDSIGKTWSRYLEPALVTSLSVVYLAWALQRVYFLVV